MAQMAHWLCAPDLPVGDASLWELTNFMGLLLLTQKMEMSAHPQVILTEDPQVLHVPVTLQDNRTVLTVILFFYP